MHVNSTTDFTSVQFDYLFEFRVDKLCSQGAVENVTISTSTFQYETLKFDGCH